MNDQEICEKLKEIGFPQEGIEKSWKKYDIDFLEGKIDQSSIDEIIARLPRLGFNFLKPENARDWEVDICAAPDIQNLLDYLGERFDQINLELYQDDWEAWVPVVKNKHGDTENLNQMANTAWRALALLVIALEQS